MSWVRRGGTSSPHRAGKPSWCNWLAPFTKMMHIAVDFNLAFSRNTMRIVLALATFLALIGTPALADARQDAKDMMSSLMSLGDVLGGITETGAAPNVIADRIEKEVVAPTEALTTAWFNAALKNKDAYLPFQVCWEAGLEFRTLAVAFVSYTRGLEKDPAALDMPPKFTEKLAACQNLL